MAKKCNAAHPTLDLKCERESHDERVAHRATDEDGNSHAWVDQARAGR